ncbi:hypothetical protein QJ857_gp0503 [Tupanvirus soda lake]|uniref:Nudix hydrolase domain-containing protein n=2 Tax=Tupanvirus TaxID=2094720 RepID=A0A6N1NW03_9VIRU|nr:hypothetical protein QJ857_gp0503 [Tupanvirus soda lake]QKU35538.1 hypothetical protein [Tupanvirus soda lake]
MSAEIIDWKWESKIIKIISDDITTDDFNLLVSDLENQNIHTIYIHINEKILDKFLWIILDRNYKFRSYDEGIYEYYKWTLKGIEDKVHPYATSTACASVMILSPDETSVLMVFENDMWKFVTGSNNFNELNLETAKREMFEEVGLEYDSRFEPKFIGMWNISGRNNGKINDVMTCYVIKAKSFTLKLDDFEIVKAKWFKINDLIPITNMINNNFNENTTEPINMMTIKHDKEKYGYPYFLWINNWLNNKYFDFVNYKNVNVIY